MDKILLRARNWIGSLITANRRLYRKPEVVSVLKLALQYSQIC